MTSLEPSDLWTGIITPVESKQSKYAIRQWRGKWRVSVEFHKMHKKSTLYTPDGQEIVKAIHKVSFEMGFRQLGGSFYVTEYKEIIKPVTVDDAVEYYFIGRFPGLKFIFRTNSGLIDNSDDSDLELGDDYPYPPVGMRYNFSFERREIWGKKIIVKEWEREEIHHFLDNETEVKRLTKLIYDATGKTSGRFYVNEHGLVFVPVNTYNGRVKYIYVTTLEISNEKWFPCTSCR